MQIQSDLLAGGPNGKRSVLVGGRPPEPACSSARRRRLAASPRIPAAPSSRTASGGRDQRTGQRTGRELANPPPVLARLPPDRPAELTGGGRGAAGPRRTWSVGNWRRSSCSTHLAHVSSRPRLGRALGGRDPRHRRRCNAGRRTARRLEAPSALALDAQLRGAHWTDSRGRGGRSRRSTSARTRRRTASDGECRGGVCFLCRRPPFPRTALPSST